MRKRDPITIYCPAWCYADLQNHIILVVFFGWKNNDVL